MLFPSSDYKYSIIYADPPWKYKNSANGNGARGGALLHYPTMNLEFIKMLPVKDITSKDCTLFILATMPLLKEALEVINSWGFQYKTCAFTWIKKYKNGKNFFGLGRWTRGNAELCLLATKGKPKRLNASISQIVESQIKRHSEKPQIVRDLIVQLVGDLPRIELFSRQEVNGWDYYGNEVKRIDPNM